MTDYYTILEVSPRARIEVIESSYKTLMKLCHPDTGKSVNGATAREINEAHEILTDSYKRKKYDNDRYSINPKQVGPYKVLSQIAEGGFGRTYKAEHTVLKELSCIKDCFNITPENTQILVDEAKAIWDLRHYALPTMRDLIQMDDGRVLLVMSYIPGPTLEQVVEKHGRIDFEATAWIMERVINGMNYLHRNGVVHGDIKPQNIIVQDDKHMAVLLDFGLSAVKPTADSEARGYTMFFAPPEEIAGKPLIPESDYYSLGMTMLYALSGGTKYVEKKMIPDDIPDEICNFVKRLITRDVNHRPQYGKDDLGDIIIEIREKVFGRRRSNLKPISS